MKRFSWFVMVVLFAGAVQHSTGAANVTGGSTDKDTLSKNALIIEALVDGPSELRVKSDGIYWINRANAKPGKHNKRNEATYVNGASWHPAWKKPKQDRGADVSSSYNLAKPVDPRNLELKLLAVDVVRNTGRIEKRSPIEVQMVQGELSIIIPDSQSDSRWYKFALIPKK